MEATKYFGKYLGVPMLHGRSSKREYQYLVEKVKWKIRGMESKDPIHYGEGNAYAINIELDSILYYAIYKNSQFSL